MVLEASTSAITLEAVSAPRKELTSAELADLRENMRLRKYPSWLPYLMALLTITAGVFSSVVSTWMNKQNAPMCAGCSEEPFVGAMLQTQQMFIAEMIALIVWWCDVTFSAISRKAPLFEFILDYSELGTGNKGHWYYWPFCAVCDFGATLMVNHAYQYTFVATVEMLRNFMVVMAAIFQIILIRKAVVRHQWIGIALITTAMILTAIPALMNPDADNAEAGSVKNTIIGVCLALGGTSVQAFQLLVEEWFFRKGQYPPLKAVGVEGITGIILTCIAWPIYQVTKTEDVNGSWYQFAHNGWLIGITVAYLPIGTVFNICGLGSTKLAGGLLRGVCFAVRAPLVWVVSMIVKWQKFDPYSLCSAIVFATGFSVYCNFYGLLNQESKESKWLRTPVPCFCTKPELDDDYEEMMMDQEDHHSLTATRESDV